MLFAKSWKRHELAVAYEATTLPAKGYFSEWAMLGSNQRPLPCEDSVIVCWRLLELAESLQMVEFL
jgi:hypothetical protein